MSMTKVQLFSIPVTDQDRARAFYVGTLGWELVRDQQMSPGMRWVQLRPPGAETSITLVTWFPSMPAGSMKGVVVETDALETDAETLRSSGVWVDAEIQQAAWGSWVTFDDPDGNGFVLQSTARVPQP
jgi:catechol 2,3-dioxygenase-like lactoylglutathione lyase family enzyme